MQNLSFINIGKVPLLSILLAVIAGILMQEFVFHFLKINLPIILCLSCLALAIVMSKFQIKKQFKSILSSGFLLASVAFLSIIITVLKDVRSNKNWFGHHLKSEEFIVQLFDAPKEKARTILLPVNVQYGKIGNDWKPLSGKLLVYVYKSESLPNFKSGQTWKIPANIVLLKHNNNPGAFDFSKKQNREGFYYQTFLSQDDLVLLDSTKSNSKIENIRNSLLSQLKRYIPESTTLALTQATLLNESDNLDAQLQADYSGTGISHIIAISGMHVQLLFGLLLLLLFWLKGAKWTWLKYLVIIPFVWIYIALCHFPPSAVRAGIGFTLTAIAIWIKRPQNVLHLLSLNAIIMLLIEPMFLFNVGVQLSFLAVLSIILFYPIINKWVYSKYKVVKWLWSTVAVSLAVQVLVFPLVIFYFHQFPIWFLPANVIAAGFSVLQMLLAFLIMLFGVLNISFLASFLGKVLVVLTTKFNVIVAWLNQHSPDVSRLIPLDVMDYWLLTLAIVFLSVFWLRKYLWSLYTGLLILLLFIGDNIYLDFIARQQNSLVVYAGTRQSTIDRIRGKSVWTYTPAINDTIYRYAIRPSRLHFRINKEIQKQLSNQYWKIGKHSIAFLNNPDSIPDSKVDYLILNADATLDAEIIKDKLKVKQVILDGSFKRSAALKYATYLDAEGINVFVVQEQGAWIKSVE